MTILKQILHHKIIAIIRGADPGNALDIVHALYEGGIRILEITRNSPDALKVIQAVEKEMGNLVTIGAGTVLDGETAKAAISVGAKFIISPIVEEETIKATKQNGAVSIPGAYTPSEIVRAHLYGGDIIKIFPSPSLSYFKNLYGPFQDIMFMPTGGIDLDNIVEFKNAGAVAFGIGSSLVDTRHKITDEYLNNIKVKAQQFVVAIK
jgi:2-dehydro-3-deoxyphosphogluconate aldolase/(4S)-4-hydroxy-2-oxoglutarate aldolase